MPIVHIPASAISPRDDVFLDEIWTSDYWIEYSKLAEQITSKKDTMTANEKEAARALFREAYERNEDEKKDDRKITTRHKFEDIVKGHGLDYLFDK